MIYPNKATVLRNEVCAYCGCHLTRSNRTKEHVIGRRFVPKGRLDKRWNLILNACCRCNNEKAALENDISAITLLPDPSDMGGLHDLASVQEAHRKAQRSVSRRSGRPVSESSERSVLSLPLQPGISATFDLHSPPSIDEKRAFMLARYQLAGFFSLLTFNEKENRGYFWTGEFLPLMIARLSDWGNPFMRGFAEITRNWQVRLIAHTADGFFAVAIRRNPSVEVWSWALEWNGSHRLIGFFGDSAISSEIAGKIPKNQMTRINLDTGGHIDIRPEIPIEPENDYLFDQPA